MLIKKLQHLATYYELYEFVADTRNTQAQIKMYLINEMDVSESTARRNIKGFVEDEACKLCYFRLGKQKYYGT